VSSEWGEPNSFTKGFNPAEVEKKYGRHLYFWDWKKREIIKKVDLGSDGLIPLVLKYIDSYSVGSKILAQS
jgi:selenium-binding protein 1